MSNIQGGCTCSAIRYEANGEPFATGACHCRACQYASGGAPAYVLVMPRQSVRVVKGTPKTHASEAENGHRVTRQFCSDCGTPLFAESDAFPQVVSLKAGSLDDPSKFQPMINLWVSAAQPWHHLDPTLPTFEKNYVP